MRKEGDKVVGNGVVVLVNKDSKTEALKIIGQQSNLCQHGCPQGFPQGFHQGCSKVCIQGCPQVSPKFTTKPVSLVPSRKMHKAVPSKFSTKHPISVPTSHLVVNL